jgi:PAS domain S-box-containing protein
LDQQVGPGFLAGGGEMGALMRRHDWSASPIGDPATWPQSLRSIVGVLLNSSLPMFVAWGGGLGFLYNDAYSNILGAKHPRALGKRFHDVWPEIWPDIAPLIDAAMAGEATFRENLPLTIRRKGFDEQTWFTFSYSPVRDENGAVAGMFCACVETTQQVIAERRLRESEDNYRHAVDLSPQTVWTARPDGQLDHVGSRWNEWTGTSGLGASWGDAVHPDDLAPSVAAWTRAVSTGEPYDIEHRVRFRDGSYRWMHSRAYPRRDGTGGIARWYGTTEDIHSERVVEEALRESEARFRNMADHAPVMMWVTDPSGYCTYLNRRWYEFTGQGSEEALGLGWTKATHPDDQKLAEDAFLSANAAQEPFRVEYRLRRADGAYRWAIDAASPRFGEDGAFLGYVGSVIDIDERREAEQALRASEARFRAFAEALPVVLFTADAEGACDYTNPYFQQLTGRDAAVLSGDGWAAVLHEEDRGRTLDAWRAARTEGRPFEIEYRFRRHDGAHRWFLARTVPVREADGAPVSRWIGTCVDIQDIVEAREQKERQGEELARLVEERTRERDRVWQNSRDLLVVVGADGVFRAVNPAWTAILGYEPAEMVGRSFLEFVWPDDSALTQGGLDTAASKNDLTDFENRYRHKDGTPRWISWRTSAEGDLVYAYGRDITAEKEAAQALRQAEEQLRQSQKMEAVGQLTGGLAHDFNNLLTGITGSLELLNTRVSQGRINEIDRYVTAAQGASKRAAALTHRLLAFSRRQTLDPKPTDVNRLVASMEELVRRTVGPEVAVETVAAGGLWTTLVDPNQHENALLNLCINARDAMPDGGRLTIETGNKWLDHRAARDRDLPPGQYVTLCVSDTGTGMTPEVARRAFDPFFTTKPIGMGTGLGLSMIYGFVRQSGGQARIYSEPGQGAMVCLYLPRFIGAAENADVPAEPAEAPRAEQGETVLVVDDEPTVRMLVAEVLEDLGYTAIEAADGAAGLKVLQSMARIDLLVTDVGLPGGMNGRQVADAARALRPGLKVLFITGYAENAVLGHGHLDPGMHVLTKPFAMEVLAVGSGT